MADSRKKSEPKEQINLCFRNIEMRMQIEQNWLFSRGSGEKSIESLPDREAFACLSVTYNIQVVK